MRLFRNRFLDGDVELSRNEIREVLPLGWKQPHDACYILHRSLGLEAAKGDDLRDMAVFLAHIVDDRGASVLADIDIDIGIL